MGKQITLLFWSFLYGEVLGYLLSALLGLQFNPVTSGIVPMLVGFLAINSIQKFISND